MVEPITVAASIFGVASAGLKLASSLYDIKTTYEGAQDSIESIASDLNFFAIVLEELGHVLNAPASQRVVSEKLIESIGQIIEKCKILFRDINKMIQKANRSKLSKLGQSIGWIFREGKVKTLMATLDSLKSTLGLMLQTLKLRKAQYKHAEKERVILRNLFNTQQRSVRKLQHVEKTSQVLADEPRPRRGVSFSDPQEMDYRDSKRPTLTSTVLLDAVPIEDQECNVGPGESPTALGIHVPADQDPSQFLLYQWTKPSEPNTMEEQTEKDSNNDAIYGMPPLFSNTYRHAYSNLVSQCESEVVMEMESFSRKLAESFKKSMSELHLKKEQNKASLSNQLEEVQKAAEADRTALEAQRALEMNNFEIQLIHKENKENTINSIRLEIETSYTNFEARVRERPAASETLQPFLAHIKGLEDRLSAENERLNELQITLADAKRRVREEFTAKLADIERIKSDKETMTMKDNEEQFRRLDEEHRGLAETLATYSNDISELQGQWLSLVQGVQKYTDLEESDSGYETSPDELKSAPSWLDEDLDDAETELGGDQEHSDGHDSDKIPEEENTPRSPPNGKSQHSPDARQNGFVPPDVSLDEQINDDEVCSGQKKQERSMERSHCHRQAWKAPLPFQSGTNILSHILSLNIEQLWFKASRDEYKFYLGSRPEPFYTVELVPEDLRNFQTAKFEWTVLHKAWANDSALRALGLGFVYKEDSDGHVWIQKELSWFHIQQLFEISCSILDDMLATASRKIMTRRSEEHGEELPGPPPKSRILRRKVKETNLHSELHGAFFRTKALED